jgi:uncharacterized protein (DUF1330 family)
MIYITQLIYLNEGEEAAFNEFEVVAIPIISKYNGQLLLRVKPGQSVIESLIEVPYEIHLVAFESDADFESFKQDEERKQFLHLKEKAIRSILMIKGEKI